jgi:hypothetical protein
MAGLAIPYAIMYETAITSVKTMGIRKFHTLTLNVKYLFKKKFNAPPAMYAAADENQ